MNDDKAKLNNRLKLIFIILIMMTIQNFIFLFLVLNERGFIEFKINKSVNNSVVTEVEKKIRILDSHIENTINAEVKKLDTFIVKSVSEEVKKIPVINGKDGLTPIVVCDSNTHYLKYTYDNGITYLNVETDNKELSKCLPAAK